VTVIEGSGSGGGASSSTGGSGGSGGAPATSTTITGGGPPICGNGVVEGPEECDDGNHDTADDCPDGIGATCVPSYCGDGYVHHGSECCDFGVDVDCDQRCCCASECVDLPTFAGPVTNDQNPAMPGPGVPSTWTYAGDVGIAAGNEMCFAIGADHVCTYEDLVAASAAGELTIVDEAITFWLWRTTDVVVNNVLVPASGDARCAEFTSTSPSYEGEYAHVSNNQIQFVFDEDGPVANGSPPCAGAARAIPCCFPACPEPRCF
jgi:hypothetical protein